MLRLMSAGALLTILALGSIGCHSCKSCGTSGHGTYWRNLGLPGKHPVGKTWCRGCDLCTDVGGPCGLWSRTGSGQVVDGGSMPSEEIIYEGSVSSGRPRGTVRVSQAPMNRKF
jgi:hypothetical protein